MQAIRRALATSDRRASDGSSRGGCHRGAAWERFAFETAHRSRAAAHSTGQERTTLSTMALHSLDGRLAGWATVLYSSLAIRFRRVSSRMNCQHLENLTRIRVRVAGASVDPRCESGSCCLPASQPAFEAHTRAHPARMRCFGSKRGRLLVVRRGLSLSLSLSSSVLCPLTI